MVETQDVLDKLVYAATNPVKDGLVQRVHHWPGVNGLSALLDRRPITVERPRHFFRAMGTMPAEVMLCLVIPPELGDSDEVRRVLRERIAAVGQRRDRARPRREANPRSSRGAAAMRGVTIPRAARLSVAFAHASLPATSGHGSKQGSAIGISSRTIALREHAGARAWRRSSPRERTGFDDTPASKSPRRADREFA